MGVLMKILSHLGAIVRVVKDVESMAKNLTSGKEKYPSKEELVALLEDVIAIVGSGIIAIEPNVQEIIVQALKDIQNEVA